jgi:hypothetical protein
LKKTELTLSHRREEEEQIIRKQDHFRQREHLRGKRDVAVIGGVTDSQGVGRMEGSSSSWNGKNNYGEEFAMRVLGGELGERTVVNAAAP